MNAAVTAPVDFPAAVDGAVTLTVVASRSTYPAPEKPNNAIHKFVPVIYFSVAPVPVPTGIKSVSSKDVVAGKALSTSVLNEGVMVSLVSQKLFDFVQFLFERIYL